MTPALRERVLAIYAEADATVAAAGPKCDASGRCCRFKEYGHTLFISNLEADVLIESSPPYSKPVSGDFCPFQEGNLCTARDPRPLGCRVYFCDPGYQEKGSAISETFLRRLKDLANEHALPWRYAPLHYFLNEAEGRDVQAVEPATSTRIPLSTTG
jgi:Fe-S-cluster containining protein